MNPLPTPSISVTRILWVILFIGICSALLDSLEMIFSVAHFLSHFLTNEPFNAIELYQLPDFVTTHLPFLFLNIILFVLALALYFRRRKDSLLRVCILILLSTLFYNVLIFVRTGELPLWSQAFL